MYLDDLYFRIVYSKNGKSILTAEYLQSINDLKYFELYKFWQDTKVLKLKLEDTIHYKLLLDRVFWKNNYIEYIKNSNQQDHFRWEHATNRREGRLAQPRQDLG